MRDRLAAMIALTLFLPIISLVAVAILLLDGLPIFFKQARLGRSCAEFCCIKFRSMVNGKVTKTGRWLRSTGLDELPQLINIAKGEMAVVGPRPLTRSDSERFGYLTDSGAALRWEALPGLTGLAQFVGTRSTAEALELDQWYVRNKSLILDVKLILATLVANVAGKSRARAWFKSSFILGTQL